MLGRHEGLSVTYRRQQLANVRESPPVRNPSKLFKAMFVGAAEKADWDRLTNLVTGYVNVVQHRTEISLAKSLKKLLHLNIFLIKIYVLSYQRLQTIPKSPIYFINYVR